MTYLMTNLLFVSALLAFSGLLIYVLKGKTMTTTFTQADIELQARDTVTARTGTAPEWETVSDAVDIYLGQIEQDTRRSLDRAAINRQDATQVIDTVVACILERSID